MKKIAILTIGVTFFYNINAQNLNQIRALDEQINISKGTQSVNLLVKVVLGSPMVFTNYRLERTNIANTSTITLQSFSGNLVNIISHFSFRDVNISSSDLAYFYKLVGITSQNMESIIAQDFIILNQPNINLDCVKLNHLYRKACHNCYQQNLSPSFTSSLFTTKVVEIDIYSEAPNDDELGLGDWQVRHGGSSGNNNNCGSGDQHFDICLQDAITFHANFPNHDPILIYVDLKRSGINEAPVIGGGGNFWKLSHRPHHLDDVLNDVGIENIYKPSDLKGSFAELRFAAEDQNWPTLGELRGKFIFVLTGNNSDLNSYLNELGNNALAFVSAKVDGENPTYNALISPKDISFINEQHVVFYNLKKDQLGIAREFMPKHGFISRVYEGSATGGVDNTSAQEYGDFIYRQVNNIAMFNFQDNFPNIIMNDKILETNITNVVLGAPPTTIFIDSKYDHITQHALQTVTTQNLKVLPGTHYNISAGQEVRLKPGTHLQAGADTRVFISNCEDYIDNMRVNPFANQEQGRALTQQEINWMLNNAKTTTNSVSANIAATNKAQPTLYPNPTTGSLTIVQLEQFAGGKLEIVNLMGQVVISQPINATTLTISLAHQPKGIYLVKISSEKENVVQKVVLE